MIDLILNFALLVFGCVFTSPLFYIPILFTLCCYLVYIVLNLVQGKY